MSTTSITVAPVAVTGCPSTPPSHYKGYSGAAYPGASVPAAYATNGQYVYQPPRVLQKHVVAPTVVVPTKPAPEGTDPRSPTNGVPRTPLRSTSPNRMHLHPSRLVYPTAAARPSFAGRH
eukprot:TRINITY_DN9071_c0_g1_i1.p1 TRINITY_DN9071_c0_g1~~TRINITY_DN9071_c0_g1_i1.p1  ORF type:complete len:120 (-),score=12.50 TRINITY_DN9071_c0_g1_i1:198-557(-)